jgi:hypothetical protein
MERLLDWGVDAIITDRPDLAARVLAERPVGRCRRDSVDHPPARQDRGGPRGAPRGLRTWIEPGSSRGRARRGRPVRRPRLRRAAPPPPIPLRPRRHPVRRPPGPRHAPGQSPDARWVQGLCPPGTSPGPRRAEPPPRSEADARHARYLFLENAAPSDALILTAHHADDQAETVLFRLARGTGLHGLRGIAPRRGRIVRPSSRSARDLEAYAATRRLSFRTDPTNLELRYARNRIRHHVLPALDAVRPGVVRAWLPWPRGPNAEAAWDQVVDAAREGRRLDADGPGVHACPRTPPLLSSAHAGRLLRRLLRRYGPAPGRAGTQAALEFINSGQSGGVLHLPGGVRLERDFDHPYRCSGRRHDRTRGSAAEIHGSGPGFGAAVVGGGSSTELGGGGARGPGNRHARAPAAGPVFPLVLRGWRPGDRIRSGLRQQEAEEAPRGASTGSAGASRVPVLVDGPARCVGGGPGPGRGACRRRRWIPDRGERCRSY